MKKILSFIIITISLFITASCVMTSTTVIEFSKMPEAYYLLVGEEGYKTEEQVKAEISIKVDGLTEYNLTSSAVVVEGLDFTTEGTKVLIVTYNNVSIRYTYNVVKNSAFNQAIDTTWYYNSNSPYTLTTAGQLRGLAKLVNEGISTFENEEIILGNNIDLGGVTWTPIGEGNRNTASEKVFKGTFDGNNKTISNMTNNGYVPSTYNVYSTSDDRKVQGYAYGLFGVIYNSNDSEILSIIIKNIKFENIHIFDSNSHIDEETKETIYSGCDSAGAVLGYTGANVNLNIQNCHVLSGNIYGFDAMGGLVGRIYSDTSDEQHFIDCSNNASVSCSRIVGGKAGGILGNSLEGKYYFEKCFNTGIISLLDTSSPNYGGVVGYIGSGLGNYYRYFNCSSNDNRMFGSSNTIFKTFSKSLLNSDGTVMWDYLE